MGWCVLCDLCFSGPEADYLRWRWWWSTSFWTLLVEHDPWPFPPNTILLAPCSSESLLYYTLFINTHSFLSQVFVYNIPSVSFRLLPLFLECGTLLLHGIFLALWRTPLSRSMRHFFMLLYICHKFLHTSRGSKRWKEPSSRAGTTDPKAVPQISVLWWERLPPIDLTLL